MTDVFSEANPNPANPVTPLAKFEDLVGEGKKFATADDLAKGKAESDAFIKHLTEELKGLRESVNRDNNASDNLATLQAEIADLKAKLNKPAEPSPDTKGELTTGQLEEIVASVITKQEQSRTTAQNVAVANSKMVEIFGDKASETFQQRAVELGMSAGELKAIAAKSPNAFYRIMGIEGAKPAAHIDTQSSKLNSAAMPSNPGQPKKGTAAYYNQVRKTIGNKAFFADTKLQQEIFQAKKNGLYDAH